MASTQVQFTMVGSEATETVCWKCKSSFDCLDAAWCFCVTRDQTIVCPYCMTCACRASAEVRSAFWSNAPRALWTKRIERSRTDNQRLKEATQREPVPEGKPVVLIADDSRMIRMMMRQVVEQAGCVAIEAADGAEALELARSASPRLVIADALMPKLDGRELARILKSDEGTRDMKVVIVSGLYTSRRYASEALSTFGADEYLTKPVDRGRLDAIILEFAIAPHTHGAAPSEALGEHVA